MVKYRKNIKKVGTHMKLKAVITFVFCGMFVILLFSSFDAESKLNYATELNLSNKMMLYAFTSDYTALSSDTASEDDTDADRVRFLSAE
jgi:hypothetical protein